MNPRSLIRDKSATYVDLFTCEQFPLMKIRRRWSEGYADNRNIKQTRRSPINEDLLSSSDFLSRSTTASPEPLISPPAQGARVWKVLSIRLDVWANATVVCV